MKKLITCMMMFIICLILGNTVKTSTIKSNAEELNSNSYDVTMRQDLLCLMMAYPEYITNVERKDNNKVYIVMKSGKKIIYDDKIIKNFEQKLVNPDLQDMMEQKYPLYSTTKLMSKNFDPGRFRVYDLLHEVYGKTEQQIEANLKSVNIGYKYFQFNNNNMAAKSLQNVMKEIIPLTQKNQNINSCVYPCSGTFNYRLIAGTNRLSPHSFGIAIDLARDRRDYWKWATPEEGGKRLASYPKEIPEVFEKNNFVWGGKWSHFDILHFEYRPEIILKAKYFGDKNNMIDNWYSGVTLQEASVKDYIEKINAALK